MIINTIVKGSSGGGDVVDVAAVGEATNAVENDKVFLYDAEGTITDVANTMTHTLTPSATTILSTQSGTGFINNSILSYKGIYPDSSSSISSIYGTRNTDGSYSSSQVAAYSSPQRAIIDAVRFDDDFYLGYNTTTAVVSIQGASMSAPLPTTANYKEPIFIVGDVDYTYTRGDGRSLTTSGTLFVYDRTSKGVTATEYASSTNRSPIALVLDSAYEDQPAFITTSFIRRFPNTPIGEVSGLPTSATRMFPFDKYGTHLLDCDTGIVYTTDVTTGDRTYSVNETLSSYFTTTTWSDYKARKIQYYNGKAYITCGFKLWVYDQTSGSVTEYPELFNLANFDGYNAEYTTIRAEGVFINFENNLILGSATTSPPDSYQYYPLVSIKSLSEVVPYQYVAFPVRAGTITNGVLTGFVKENKGTDAYGNTVLSVATTLDPNAPAWSDKNKLFGFNVLIEEGGKAPK